MQKKLLTKFNIHYGKNSQKMGIEGTYLNIIKAIYDKFTHNHTQSWKAESIPSKIRNKTRIPTLAIFIQCSIGNCRHNNQTKKEKEIKEIQIGKDKIVTVYR